GEGAETIRAVALQGLPPGDIHAPAAFLRHRLLRYLPPLPHWPTPPPAPKSPTTPTPPPTAPKVSLTKPTPPRPGSPAHIIQNGGTWREALHAAAVPMGVIQERRPC
ncbi:hypothetical protein RM572_28045, partial [Streptomyces sp. DSM 42041]|nr:hypothetical protein [Streptomyces sp. DSM 42041]